MGVVKIKVEGLKELDAALRDLGPRTSNKLATRGLHSMGEVIAAKARATVAVSDRNEPHIADNIQVVVDPSNGSALRTGKIGFSPSVNWRVGWLEYGVANDRKGHGAMPAKPFMRPAIDEMSPEAVAIMGDELGEDIEMAAEGYTRFTR